MTEQELKQELLDKLSQLTDAELLLFDNLMASIIAEREGLTDE